MTFRSLREVPLPILTATFNHAFSDYVVPFHLTETQLQNKLLSDGVRLDLSAGAFDGDQLIGFILHGYDMVQDKAVCYNAGTGVIPEKRGQRITARLYDFILPELKAKHIQSVQLEVITSNGVAVGIYRAIGFETSRELDCYKGKVALPDSGKFQIRNLDGYDWSGLRSFWEWNPSWQNSITAVENVKNSNISIGAYDGDTLVGYLIYNPVTNRVQQFAVHADYRRQGAARQLFAHVVQPEGKELVLINIDHNSEETAVFLRALELQIFIRQYEMNMILT